MEAMYYLLSCLCGNQQFLIHQQKVIPFQVNNHRGVKVIDGRICDLHIYLEVTEVKKKVVVERNSRMEWNGMDSLDDLYDES